MTVVPDADFILVALFLIFLNIPLQSAVSNQLNDYTSVASFSIPTMPRLASSSDKLKNFSAHQLEMVDAIQREVVIGLE